MVWRIVRVFDLQFNFQEFHASVLRMRWDRCAGWNKRTDGTSILITSSSISVGLMFLHCKWDESAVWVDILDHFKAPMKPWILWPNGSAAFPLTCAVVTSCPQTPFLNSSYRVLKGILLCCIPDYQENSCSKNGWKPLPFSSRERELPTARRKAESCTEPDVTVFTYFLQYSLVSALSSYKFSFLKFINLRASRCGVRKDCNVLHYRRREYLYKDKNGNK